MKLVLDKSSPLPLYYQLAEALKEHVRAGTLQPHARVPSERELAEYAGISRMTARQAIAHLVREGTLVVRPGVGTFVAEPKVTHHALHLLGFTEESMRRGRAVSSRVLEQQIVQPPADIRTGLHLDEHEVVTNIVRLRSVEGTPLLLEAIFVPQALCPGLEQENLAAQSLYAIMEQRHGLRLLHARQSVEAVGANEYESGLFGVAPGTALLALEGVAFLDDGRPVEYFKAVYRGDRIRFELESHRAVPTHLATMPRVSVRLVP